MKMVVLEEGEADKSTKCLVFLLFSDSYDFCKMWIFPLVVKDLSLETVFAINLYLHNSYRFL